MEQLKKIWVSFLLPSPSLTYNLAGSLDSFTFLDQSIRAEKHDTDLTSLQVHAHALDARCEPVLDE